VVSNVPTNVIPNWQENFTVTFTPTVSGVQTSTITINNNDTDEGTYTFNVSGEGICPVTNTISAVAATVVPNQVGSIRVESQLGVSYQLQNVSAGNSNVGNPIQGTGGIIYLPTLPLSTSTDFRVVATRGLNCGNQILNTVTITVSGLPYGYQQTQINSCVNANSVADIDVTLTGSNYLWSNSSTTQDISNVTNGVYSLTVDGTTTLPVIVGVPIEWENLIRATTSNDGRVAATGSFAWDVSEAAATSKAVLEANETGGITFLVEDLATISNSMVGFALSNLWSSYKSIKNSFYVAPDRSLYVYYNNTSYIKTPIKVLQNDRLTLTRVGNAIRYYHNATLVYTDVSATNQTSRFVIDMALLQGQSPQVWFSKCATQTLKIAYTQSSIDDCSTGSGEGAISLSPQEGVAPYSYLWSDGNTSNTRTGLSVGLQQVTVTDATTHSQVVPVVIGTPIVWTEVQNLLQNNGILAAQPTANYTTGGAISATGFTGDGGITYLYDASNITYMMGLSAFNTNPSWTSLGYSIYAYQNNAVVYENGVIVHTNTSLQNGDRLSILRQSGVVKYYINTRLIYTSTVTPATTLYADASVSQGFSPLVYASFCTQTAANLGLRYTQTSVDDCTTAATGEGAVTLTGTGGITSTYSYNWDAGASTANPRSNLDRGLYTVEVTNGVSTKTTPIVVGGFINWTNLTPNTTQIGGTIATTTTTTWTSPQGGISTNRLAANAEGGISYVIDDLSKAGNYQVGLSLPTATATTWETLGYSLWIGAQNRVVIYENGTQFGPFDPILAGDRISIIRRGGNIEYYVNSHLIRQVATTMTDELAADISLVEGTSPIIYSSFCNPGFRVANKVETPTKAEQLPTTENFVVYPNPSTGRFTIRFGNVLSENTQITVFDGIGRVINSQVVEQGKQEISIELKNQAKGMYLIQFKTNQTNYSKTIILE
jgi:hypothetical protein